ncbi:MAG TPA: PIG-L deacetylase family protein [Acidobacteriota bacterium]|nr:PIG-L deacetylase family protein [Acidobacteriota bacterium]
MIDLKLATGKKGLKVLCLGAHSDDIEIGCGGTVLKLIREYPAVEFDWVVFSAAGTRKKEAVASAAAFLKGVTRRTVKARSFKDGYFPYIGGEIKDYFEGLKKRVRPDLIFTHFRSDLHQDHRLISELTWNTFRDHLILEYEVPKYDGDLVTPNVFVDLDEAVTRHKIQAILKCFPSQSRNRWFTEDAFRAILRLRGVESNSPTGFAEGFHGRKLRLF